MAGIAFPSWRLRSSTIRIDRKDGPPLWPGVFAALAGGREPRRGRCADLEVPRLAQLSRRTCRPRRARLRHRRRGSDRDRVRRRASNQRWSHRNVAGGVRARVHPRTPALPTQGHRRGHEGRRGVGRRLRRPTTPKACPRRSHTATTTRGPRSEVGQRRDRRLGWVQAWAATGRARVSPVDDGRRRQHSPGRRGPARLSRADPTHRRGSGQARRRARHQTGDPHVHRQHGSRAQRTNADALRPQPNSLGSEFRSRCEQLAAYVVAAFRS